MNKTITFGSLVALILCLTMTTTANGQKGVSVGGPFGVVFGGGRGLSIGGPDGVQIGGGNGARFGGRHGLQFGDGNGFRFGQRPYQQQPGYAHSFPGQPTPAQQTPAQQTPALAPPTIEQYAPPFQPRHVQPTENNGPITIHHPESARRSVHFEVNGSVVEIFPGETLELNGAPVIRMQTQNRLAIRRTLSSGQYQFRETSRGWVLFRSQSTAQTPSFTAPSPATAPPPFGLSQPPRNPNSVLDITGPGDQNTDPLNGEQSVLDRNKAPR